MRINSEEYVVSKFCFWAQTPKSKRQTPYLFPLTRKTSKVATNILVHIHLHAGVLISERCVTNCEISRPEVNMVLVLMQLDCIFKDGNNS